MSCSHSSLCFKPSAYAEKAGYRHFSIIQRIAATLLDLPLTSETESHRQEAAGRYISTIQFPAPLVLPGDDLAYAPDNTGQTASNWFRMPGRNHVTSSRRTIYVAAPPATDKSARKMDKWVEPINPLGEESVKPPQTQDIIDYLTAFYHPLPVKQLPVSALKFTSWPASPNDSSRIGVRTAKEIFGIEYRPPHDGLFPAQLNLTELLDVTLAVLPSDAFALLLLVNQDIYEDEEDDFACGRAYGGSRIAVVSTARYNPALDAIQQVERDHAWPASHCEKYMQSYCDAETDSRPRKRAKTTRIPKKSAQTEWEESKDQAFLRAAVAAHIAHTSPTSPQALRELWLARICRTASHELGYCFGMDHCVFHACSMQGTASIREDARQPLYLCPVDLTKVCQATGTSAKAHYEVLLAFCKNPARADGQLWAAFRAWLEAMLDKLASE